MPRKTDLHPWERQWEVRIARLNAYCTQRCCLPDGGYLGRWVDKLQHVGRVALTQSQINDLERIAVWTWHATVPPPTNSSAVAATALSHTHASTANSTCEPAIIHAGLSSPSHSHQQHSSQSSAAVVAPAMAHEIVALPAALTKGTRNLNIIPDAAVLTHRHHQYRRLASVTSSQTQQLLSHGFLGASGHIGDDDPGLVAPPENIFVRGLPLYVLGRGAYVYVGRRDDGNHVLRQLSGTTEITAERREFLPLPVMPAMRGDPVIIYGHQDAMLCGQTGLAVEDRGASWVVYLDAESGRVAEVPKACLGTIPPDSLPQLESMAPPPPLTDGSASGGESQADESEGGESPESTSSEVVVEAPLAVASPLVTRGPPSKKQKLTASSIAAQPAPIAKRCPGCDKEFCNLAKHMSTCCPDLKRAVGNPQLTRRN